MRENKTRYHKFCMSTIQSRHEIIKILEGTISYFDNKELIVL